MYLYIVEDATFVQKTSEPDEQDYQFISNGVLEVIRFRLCGPDVQDASGQLGVFERLCVSYEEDTANDEDEEDVINWTISWEQIS